MKMIEVKIQGVPLTAALLNPKVAKQYEDGFDKIVETNNEAKHCRVGSKAIEMQCNAVISFIDDVFGKGSARRVLGEETDLLSCLEVFQELSELYEKQVVPLIDQSMSEKAVMADGD